MAGLLGIDTDRTISLTFVIGAALAAVAGLMFLLYYGVIDFFIGFIAGVKAFTAAVLGGIGSLPGAVLGGLAIGLIETFWSAYFSVAIQGRGGVQHPGHRADLHADRPARPRGRGEGMSAARSRDAVPVGAGGARPVRADDRAADRVAASSGLCSLPRPLRAGGRGRRRVRRPAAAARWSRPARPRRAIPRQPRASPRR